ncbi:MAG TPA: VIT1/CCC1 transporter family protein [Thermoplasmata archaeon]|nr:VIT1/CCC1 transporter family protein [Thermoplasmata archaeon]HUJ78197.1 VIT1/CCC1 transporter family protein [Thermoplasmata archaeon]
MASDARPLGKQAVWHEAHPHPTLLSDFILGGQDGIINVLGIVLGLVAATSDIRIVFVATLSAMGAESIAMGAVAYTSTLSRRRLYLNERRREIREMAEVPDIERAEVREVLAGWGYTGADLDDLLDRICRNPTAMLEFMMSFELKLAPVEEDAARTSAIIVGGATVLGHGIPLVPFLFVGNDLVLGAILAVVASAVTLFAIGWYEARMTAGQWLRDGIQLAVIGIAGGFAGFLIGHLLSVPGL